MMLRSTLAALAAAAACCMGPALAASEPAPYHVGQAVRAFRPDAPRHWRGAQTHALRTTIWYPAGLDAPEVPHDIGEPGRRTFQGHPLADGAPMSAARPTYPLLLLSHGTGGTADSLDWLAAALAAQGYIVAGVDHPGNTMLAPLTREGFRLWWERATDLSQALDGLLADPVLGPRIDADRIGAVGFSLGGYTVLELAGARTNLPAFEHFCASPDADAICHPPEMRRAQGDARAADAPSPETAASLARAGASYRDTRIKAVFAIAPALGMAFDDSAFAEVRIPVALIAGTADVTAPVDTNIRRIGGLLPGASMELIPGAAHYTFLDTCLPPLVERLAPVCKEAPGVDRDTVHAHACPGDRACAGVFHRIAAGLADALTLGGAHNPAARNALRGQVVRPRHHFEKVPVRVIEVEAAPTVVRIRLAGAPLARIGPVREPLLPHPREDRIERRLADQEGVVLRSDRPIAVEEVERDAVVELHHQHLPERDRLRQIENLPQEARRPRLVPAPDDGVIQLHAHVPPPLHGANGPEPALPEP